MDFFGFNFKARASFKQAWLGLGILFGLSGCILMDSEGLSIVTGCKLDATQSASLLGRFEVLPIPIALQAGAFGAYETSEIIAAAEAWNRYSRVAIGRPIFDHGDGRTSANKKPTASTACTSRLVTGGAFVQPFVIYKNGGWPNAQSDVIAITGVCRANDTPFKSHYAGYMDLNYTTFFVPGRRLPDLRSIVVHELGHLLGLDHSCNSSGDRNGLIGCDNDAIPSSFLSASMYPSVLFDSSGRGQQRRAPAANDEGRANCLYDDLKMD